MNSKVNLAVVGAFVLVLSGAFIGLTLWLSAGEFEDKSYSIYVSYMSESVSGLNLNAPVKYRGVEVGRVTGIELDPEDLERVRVLMEIEDGVPVKTDTSAVLSSQALTGIAFVDLTGGSREAGRLKAMPGEDYPVINAAPSLLTRVDTALTIALGHVNLLAQDLHGLLNDENRANFGKTMQNLAQLTASLADSEKSLRATLDRTAVMMDNAARASANLPELLERIGESAAAVERMSMEISRLGQGANRTLQDSQGNINAFTQQTLPETASMVAELRELSATLQRVGRMLEREPTALLYGEKNRAPGPGE
jgi:phospholipid/cholesterol/gamma-HCH transport system substrate-binding protein